MSGQGTEISPQAGDVSRNNLAPILSFEVREGKLPEVEAAFIRSESFVFRVYPVLTPNNEKALNHDFDILIVPRVL